MDKIAPNSVFDKRRAKRYRKRKLIQMVPKMLRPIWQHCEEIFCQAAVPEPRPCQVKSDVRTPSINWSKVNTRMVTNLPRPQDYPVLSCSQDPKFYESSDWFANKFPFGSKPGFLTNLGVIGVPGVNDVIHGHVYDLYWGWILHAGYAEEREETIASTRATVKTIRRAERRQHTSQMKRKHG